MSCGWCNKKASTRSIAHTHNIDECPELAKAICGFCGQSGHTTGHCSVRKTQKRDRRRDRRQAAQICDSAGFRVSGGKPSVASGPSHNLTSVNPFMACELIAPDEVRKSTQDRFECEKCGFQQHTRSCLALALARSSAGLTWPRTQTPRSSLLSGMTRWCSPLWSASKSTVVRSS
jgi:hypothetical protein